MKDFLIKPLVFLLAITALVQTSLIEIPTIHAAGESISGIVYEDLDYSNALDGAETGILGGVTVNLLDDENSLVATTTTAPDGSYSFNDPDVVVGESYTVVIVPPPSWLNTAVTTGSLSLNVDPLTLAQNVNMGMVGLFHQAVLAGMVFHDSDGDGTFDNGIENTINGMFVTLYQYGDPTTQLGTVRTNNGGEFSFVISATETTNYYVELTNLFSSFGLTIENANTIAVNDVGDSDFGTDQRTDIIPVDYGTEITNADAGIVLSPFTIGDFVFDDTDDPNGVQQMGENGLEAVDIDLWDRESNSIVASASTDGTGLYELQHRNNSCLSNPDFSWDGIGTANYGCMSNQADGAYYLQFATGPTCEIGELRVTLTAPDGETVLYNEICSNSGNLHNNSAYVVGPFPVSQAGEATLVFTREGTSDPDAYISNIMLTYSNYRVQFSSLPDGYGFNSPQDAGGDESEDSDVNGSGSTTTSFRHFYYGQETSSLDAAASLSSADLSLTKSANKVSSFPGDHITYLVTLTNTGPNTATNIVVQDTLPSSGIIYDGFQVTPAMSSNFDSMTGEWTIPSLMSGGTVSIQIQVSVVGNSGTIVNTAEIISADTIDSDSTFGDGIDQDDYKTASVNLTSGGGGGGSTCEEEDTCVGGRVFFDSNGNGLQDIEDNVGASGVSVGLIRVSDLQFIATATTNGSGEYIFSSNGDDVVDGVEYRVKFLPPDDNDFTLQNVGGNDDLDSDPNPTNGETNSFTLSAQEHKDNVDAGLVNGGGGGGGGDECEEPEAECGFIRLQIFFDDNGDGDQDDGEMSGGPSGLIIRIEAEGGSFELGIEDTDNGLLEGNLPAGNYNILIITPEGYSTSGPGSSSITIVTEELTDLGEIGIVSSGGGDCEDNCGGLRIHLFNDANGNGTQEDGESDGGPAGTVIRIQAEDGQFEVPIEETEEGTLEGELGAGDYTISIIAPDGYSVTGGNSTNEITIVADEVTDLGSRGITLGEDDEDCEGCGAILLHIFTDTNGNGVQDDGEPDSAEDTVVYIESDSDTFDPTPDEDSGNVEGEIPAGTYIFTIVPPDGSVVTGGNASFEVVVADGDNLDLGARGVFAGETGRVLFHIFTDDNGDGDQDSGDDDNADDTTLHILNTDDDSEQDVDFDSDGNIDSHLVPGNYTFTLIIPSGATVTGTTTPLNPITNIIITADETTDIGSRGIYFATSNGGGGGGSGGNRGSTRHVNWGDLGKSNDDGGSTWVSGSIPTSNDSDTPSRTVSNPLPPVVPTYVACMVSGGSSPKSFNDTSSTPDLDFLTSLTFISEPGRGLINGYSDGTFGPTRPLTRFELLKIALSSNCAGSGGTSSLTQQNTTFSDVPQDDSEQSRVIGEAYALGIIKGVDGKFYPDAPVSFAEMIKMLFNSSAYFKDGQPVAALEAEIPGLTDQSFAQAIAYAQRLEILPFTNDTPFPQNEDVERSTMITVLANFIRAMGGTVLVN